MNSIRIRPYEPADLTDYRPKARPLHRLRLIWVQWSERLGREPTFVAEHMNRIAGTLPHRLAEHQISYDHNVELGGRRGRAGDVAETSMVTGRTRASGTTPITLFPAHSARG